MIVDHLEETYSVLTADEESLFASDLSDRESTDGSLVAVSLVEDSDDYEHSTDGELDDLVDPMLSSFVNDTPRDGGVPFRFSNQATMDALELLPVGASWLTEGSNDTADATIASSLIELVFPDPTSSCSSSSSTITDPSFPLLGLAAPATKDFSTTQEKAHEQQYIRLLRALRKADALEEWLEAHQDGSAEHPPADLDSRRLMTTRERADALETWLLEKRLDAAGLVERQVDGNGSARRRVSHPTRSRASAADNLVEEQTDAVPQALRFAVRSVIELVCVFARLVDLAVGKMFRGWLPLVLLLTFASDVWYQYSMMAAHKASGGLSTVDQAATSVSPIAFAHSAISAMAARAQDFAYSDIMPFTKRERAFSSKKQKPFVMPSGRDRLRRHFARIKQQSKAAARDLRARLKNGARELKAKRRKVTFREIKDRLRAAPSTVKRWTANFFVNTSKAASKARIRADQVIYKKSGELLKALQSFRARAEPATKHQFRLVRDKLRRAVKKYLLEKEEMQMKRGISRKSSGPQPKTVAHRSRLESMLDRLRHVVNQYLALHRH